MLEWDEAKRLRNLAIHGVDFAIVEDFDWSNAYVLEDKRRDYGEQRWVAFGPIGAVCTAWSSPTAAATSASSACARRTRERSNVMAAKSRKTTPRSKAPADPDAWVMGREGFAGFRPAADVFPDLVADWNRRKRGPQKSPTKVSVSIRLDRDIVGHYRAGGPGWQSRLNDDLRRTLPKAKRTARAAG